MALVVGESSSSSTRSTSIPLPRSWTYHVFLSFRGEDTRKTFTDHLNAALQRKGIKTFRDDKDLERGEVIAVELLRAIEESMFAITVLSPSYASSAWCLDELQKIVECSKNLGLSVVPVFHGVEPSDVRYQKGNFGQAFRKHEERFGQESEKVKRWKNALTQVASYSGWDSKDKHEATLVESIAQHIHKKLIPKLPSFTKHLVGIVSRVEEVIKHIGIGLNDVRFIGIWGMGGIGKTTIARAVYEAIQGEFKVSCFLANVREACERSGIVQVQKELVAQMNINMSTFYNEYDGRRIIQNSLCHKKVLLVLDDVSKESQLKNLAGEQDWFGSGSRIIITTRDIQLLNIQEVHGTYNVEGLGENEAFDLFCLKAFKQQKPIEGYLDLSKEVVNYSDGLPLALEVMGSYLYRRPIDVWRSAIEKLKSALRVEILDTLKISYDGLDFMEKNIFLDIACFFKGMEKDKVIDILKKCGYCAEIGIAILIDRSLVTINQNNDGLDMHDLLQEMGRNIVIQESQDNPGKRSRLWSKEDIDLLLTQNMGTEAIQSIALDFPWFFGFAWGEGGFSSEGIGVSEDIVVVAPEFKDYRYADFRYYAARWRDKAFSNIAQLKFLSLNGVRSRILVNLPSSLKVLHWEFCPLNTLPLTDQQYELVEIKLPQSKIVQIWHGKKFLGKLKHVDLTTCLELKEIPDLSGVPIVETLLLSHCLHLTDIHPSIIQHKNLVTLNLNCCPLLKPFPGKLEMSSLKELYLNSCSSLEKLPEFGECMKHLSILNLGFTRIRELPTSLGCLVALEELHLPGCRELTCLPNSIPGLKSLRILDVSWCPKLRGLQHSLSGLDLRDFCYFPSLTDLDLSYGDFVTVPVRIHELPKLRRLNLNGCKMLDFLPELPSSIRELQACDCYAERSFIDLFLKKKNFIDLSKACCVFASTSHDRGEFLQMLISVWEIPSWFVHLQEGNGASVPLPHNCLEDERLGIALCFRLLVPEEFPSHLALVVYNGEEFVTKRTLVDRLPTGSGPYLHVLCFTIDYFSDEFHQNNCFKLLRVDGEDYVEPGNIFRSAARWVSKKDIEDYGLWPIG